MINKLKLSSIVLMTLLGPERLHIHDRPDRGRACG